MKFLSSLAIATAAVPAVVGQSLPLSTTSRWIVDSDGARVKFKCINWAGHMEVNVPEGLNKQSIEHIADFVESEGFNCVRLTYSIDHALNPDRAIADSFTDAAGIAGVNVTAMEQAHSDLVAKNPSLDGASIQNAHEKVIAALWDRGVMTIIDNHVSKPQWCCNLTDGNGWWDDDFPYIEANSQYFKVDEWLDGLEAMAKWAADQPGVVGMGLRNEIREFPPQGYVNGRSAWYDHIKEAGERVHAANEDVLVIVGGTLGGTDLTHIRDGDMLEWDAWAGKHVWEWHTYSYSVTFSINPGDSCDVAKAQYGLFDGFVLRQNETYTAPLWTSEFGFSQVDPSDEEQKYFDCLIEYMTDNDQDWGMWALEGSYYVRDGTLNSDEGYGYMDIDWNGARNPDVRTQMDPIFKTTQGP